MLIRKYSIVPAVVDEILELDRVFSGFPVGVAGQVGSFGLYTTTTHQFIAYYDADRRLCVASRALAEATWNRVFLDEALGWDSHNYVTLAIDAAGHVHVSGNMHASPLCYFRSAKPRDVATLQRVRSLTGENEDEMTYPCFLHDADRLLFTYRSGRSGAGNQIVKAYDCWTERWSELHQGPLIDGEGRRNAYVQGPVRGRDGYFHLCWVWRDTPDAATTHSLCYARSRDLQQWETSDGMPIPLPITFDRAEIVDAIGRDEGLINNNHLIGFDGAGHVIVTFQKYDEFGNTQIYQARRERGDWVVHRSTDWAHRWEIRGQGSIVFELRFGPVETDTQGRLLQWYRHARFGVGTLILDPETLQTIGLAPGLRNVPDGFEKPASNFPGMQVNWAIGEGSASDADRFLLRWESLPENRDAPRESRIPDPSALALYRITPGELVASDQGALVPFYWNSLPDCPRPSDNAGGPAAIHAKTPKRRSRLGRLVAWSKNLAGSRAASARADVPSHVKDQAQADAAFAAGDYAAAAQRWQGILQRYSEQQIVAVGDIRLNLSVARRLARLQAYRNELNRYAANHALRFTFPARQKAIAIYTAITGDYDSVKLPEAPDRRIDYVLFSDAPRSGAGLWQVRPITAYQSDPIRMARYVKTHPHTLLSGYDLAIWIDSNIMILGDIHGLLEEFVDSKHGVGAIPHPFRTSIYEEIGACIDANRDDADVMRKQIGRYDAAGFKHDDLIESNLMMFDLTASRLHDFLDLWWSEIDRGSRRDQLSLNYALAHTGLGWHRITSSPDSARNHPVLAFGSHDNNRGPAHRLLEAIGTPATDPYGGRAYAEVKDERIAAQRERNIDVVICVHNALDDVKSCLASVKRHRLGPRRRIIIVDDGSESPTTDFLLGFANHEAGVELIRNDQACGYTRAANAGLAASRGEFVILLNSDTIVTHGWAEKLADAVFSTPGAGIAGPMSNAASFQSIPCHRGTESQTAINPLPPDLTAEDINRYCEHWTVAGLLPHVPLVHGFCFGVAREVIEKIGYFDEQHFPRGYGEENDYCFRAADAGFGLVLATHTFVFHAKSRSYGDTERIALMQDAAGTFERLHGTGRIHRAVEAMEHNPFLERLRRKARALFTDRTGSSARSINGYRPPAFEI